VRVSASQVGVAGTSYLALALGGRTLDAASFAAFSAFYLAINVLGRGLLSATELELTRAVAAAGDDRAAVSAATRGGVRHTLVLTGLAVLGVLAASPVLLRAVDGDVVVLVVLAAAMPGMAASYVLRGPLAGSLRYGAYARTFFVEAGVILLGAAACAVSGTTDVRLWVLGMALGPVAGTLSVLVPQRAAARALLRGSTVRHGRAVDLAASVALLGCAQAVWNVPPVLLTASSADVAVAAGFAAVAIVLRAPVMLFPGLQAMLLPAMAARPGALPRPPARVLALVAGLVVVWVVGAVVLTPVVVDIAFGGLPVPGVGVLAALAVATVLGGAAQGTQTALVARRRQVPAAAVWVVAITVLVAVVALGPATPGWATAGLLVGVALAVVGFAVLLLRPTRTPVPGGAR
jgi:O-antigen/teichoic acid export membrane protein